MALKPKKKNPKQLPKNVTARRRKPKAAEPKHDRPAPKIGRVRLWTNDPNVEVTGRLAEERPNVEAGYGGWEEVARPRRRPLTTWRGLPGLRMTLPILFDGWAKGTSVEGKIKDLEKMGHATARGGEPPIVHIKALGSAVPYQGRTWVITELVWGEALMNRYGDRVRQQVTVSLLEYIPDIYVVYRSASKRRRAAKGAKHPKPSAKNKRASSRFGGKKKKAGAGTFGLEETVEFGAGEDLLSLAARELGDAERWLEIAELNGIRDPRSIDPGQVIVLP